MFAPTVSLPLIAHHHHIDGAAVISDTPPMS